MHDRYNTKMRAANSSPIHVYGCKDLAIQANGVGTRVMECSVGDITKNLLSVHALVQSGCVVIFDKNPRIIDPSGKVIPMLTRRASYDVEFWLEPFATSPQVKARSRG